MTRPPRLHLAEVPSTSTWLFEHADGHPHLTALSADRQTAGRGRRERRWMAVPGNLAFSVLVKSPIAAGDLWLLNAAAPLALLETLAPRGPRLAIKWPNDLLAAGRKVAGILVETRIAGNRLDHAVLGFGVNAVAVPDGIEGPHTPPGDLAAFPACADRAAVIDGVVDALAGLLPAGRPDREAIAGRFTAALEPAARLRFRLPDRSDLDATVTALAPDGTIRVRDDAGREFALPEGAIYL